MWAAHGYKFVYRYIDTDVSVQFRRFIIYLKMKHIEEGCCIVLRSFLIYQTTQFVTQWCCCLTCSSVSKYRMHFTCVRQDLWGITGVCCPYYVTGIASEKKCVKLSSLSLCVCLSVFLSVSLSVSIVAAYSSAVTINHVHTEEMLYVLFDIGGLENVFVGRVLKRGKCLIFGIQG